MRKTIYTKEYYGPTFLDESRDLKDKKTGRLEATLFTIKYDVTQGANGKVRIEKKKRCRFVAWDKDTLKAKVEAIKLAIEGMEELQEVDDSSCVDFIPSEIKEWVLKYENT